MPINIQCSAVGIYFVFNSSRGPFSRRLRPWGVTQNHLKQIRSAGHEVVACWHIAQDDTCQASVVPQIGAVTDIVTDGNGARVRCRDVGQTSHPLICSLAKAVQAQLIALQQ